eukprot:2806939-Rhodomonas_salina.1
MLAVLLQEEWLDTPRKKRVPRVNALRPGSSGSTTTSSGTATTTSAGTEGLTVSMPGTSTQVFHETLPKLCFQKRLKRQKMSGITRYPPEKTYFRDFGTETEYGICFYDCKSDTPPP